MKSSFIWKFPCVFHSLACEEVFKSSPSIGENLYKVKQSTLHPQQSSENIFKKMYIYIYTYIYILSDEGNYRTPKWKSWFQSKVNVGVHLYLIQLISPKRNGIGIIPDSSIRIIFSAATSAATPPPPGFCGTSSRVYSTGTPDDDDEEIFWQRGAPKCWNSFHPNLEQRCISSESG